MITKCLISATRFDLYIDKKSMTFLFDKKIIIEILRPFSMYFFIKNIYTFIVKEPITITITNEMYIKFIHMAINQ